ncbi:MAG: DUF4351 domain-containing protein [Acidobacteria bacterium]|nr:DUF4351 domain-containing protein [Acidobacteriota bacterium]
MAIQEVFPQDEFPTIAPFAMTWLEEGRQEGAVAFALRLLRKRFGEVGSETEARIEALSLGDLEGLGEDLLDFSSVDDLTAWLRSHVVNGSAT